jgi:hypothetical protein
MNILLTGGTGYIGSHTAVALAEAGHHVVLFDNFCNSQPDVAQRLHTLTGQALPLVEGDVRNTALLTHTLQAHQIGAVIHFAGLKAVGESVAQPLAYYANNVQGSISLLQAMQAAQVNTLVFSSSATVYGEPHYLPLDETHPTAATNPYGRSKLQVEEILAMPAPPTRPCGCCACATSTPWARTPRASSATTPGACPTTSCPTCRASPRGSCPTSTSSAPTTPRLTAPACATTSTWPTWPAATSRPWPIWRSTRL